jgi:hypothetical protein
MSNYPTLDEIEKIEIYHDGENIIPMSNLLEVSRIIKSKILKEITGEDYSIFERFEYNFYFPSNCEEKFIFNETINYIPVEVKDSKSLDISIYSDILKNTLKAKFEKYIVRVIISNDKDFRGVFVKHEKLKYILITVDDSISKLSEEYEADLIIKEISIISCDEISRIKKRKREEDDKKDCISVKKACIPSPPPSSPPSLEITPKTSEDIKSDKLYFLKEQNCSSKNFRKFICYHWFFHSCLRTNCSYYHPNGDYSGNSSFDDKNICLIRENINKKYGKTICWKWYHETCNHGDNCWFLHPNKKDSKLI